MRAEIGTGSIAPGLAALEVATEVSRNLTERSGPKQRAPALASVAAEASSEGGVRHRSPAAGASQAARGDVHDGRPAWERAAEQVVRIHFERKGQRVPAESSSESIHGCSCDEALCSAPMDDQDGFSGFQDISHKVSNVSGF